MTTKKVKLQLVGLDGNAFSLMGAFQRQASKEGWLQAEINEILEECKSSDYNHLVATLADHCGDPDEDSWDEDDEEFDDQDNADEDDEDDDERDPDGPFDPIDPEDEEDDDDEC